MALQKVKSKNVLILNGDTFFKIDLLHLANFHFTNNSSCTLALKQMENFERYGVVEINDKKKIISFKEKQFYKDGLINAGVYALNKDLFLNLSFPEIFSFEKAFLETYYSSNNFYGFPQKGYFIDIGIPEDFKIAQIDFETL